MNTQQSIERKLRSAFSPTYFELINESHMHNVAEGAQSHFKLIICSDSFSGLSKIKRQQNIYHVLQQEMAAELHALSIKDYSPQEWQLINKESISRSPECRGCS